MPSIPVVGIPSVIPSKTNQMKLKISSNGSYLNVIIQTPILKKFEKRLQIQNAHQKKFEEWSIGFIVQKSIKNHRVSV